MIIRRIRVINKRIVLVTRRIKVIRRSIRMVDAYICLVASCLVTSTDRTMWTYDNNNSSVVIPQTSRPPSVFPGS